MQNFNSGPNDAVTAGEAQEILAALSNRMATRGVDPSVGSVQGLAAGLGVSEEHVREMLEDIRVHKRSQQIAAGILDEQQKQRKKSDVSAAIVAAIAIVLVGLVIGAFLLFADRGVGGPPSGFPPINPPIPPIAVVENNTVSIVDTDGSSITVDSTGYHKVSRDGAVISLGGDQALNALKADIETASKQLAELRAKKELTSDEDANLDRLRARVDALKAGLKILVTLPGTPAPDADGP